MNPEGNYRKVTGMYFFESKEQIESYCRDAGLVINESIEIKQRAVHESLSDIVWLMFLLPLMVFFDLDLIEEQNLEKFDRWIDDKGRVIHEFPIGIILARKAFPPQ